MRFCWRTSVRVTLGVAAVGAAVGFLSGPIAADEPAAPQASDEVTPVPPARAPSRAGRTFPGLDPSRHRVEDGVALADLADGSTALLSLDPSLQAHLTGIFARHEVPFGAAIALEPATGRVLAYVSHSSEDPSAGDLVLDPSAPAASVFKIVTGAALFEAGVSPDAEVCYHGGLRRLNDGHLEDDPARDRSCASLAGAMGGSINPIFAKLAVRHLDPPTLERYASAFGFGHALPFDVPTRASPMEVPPDRLEFARTAAGFWHMHLSPLHGALIAATIANGGRMPRPTLVDEVIDASGAITYEASPAMHREVIAEPTAAAVTRMMQRTLARGGTGRQWFFDPSGEPFLPGIEVAGKTGTLASNDPYRSYTWFVGFAPVEEPRIAVAALVVNGARWRIKGSFVAREAMRHWLVTRPRQLREAARRAEREAAASAAEPESDATAAR
ncbi:MAG: penicillin-binding protein [Sandaracinaceae bacterium]|nr:penicillin-binding protein [Sandaracinaceae bacterium]